MGRIKVVHTADLHLGAPCRGLPPSIGRQRRKDYMQTLAKISEICKEEQTDLLLIAGDLWEEQYVTRPLVDFVADQFRRIPETKVVIAPGNSDFNHPNSFYREYPWPDNVHIFHEPHLSSIWIPHLNARIYGCAWRQERGGLDWEQLKDSAGAQVVVVAYGTPEDLAIPSSILELSNLAYVALGGAHEHVVWSPKMLAPGSPEPLDFSCRQGHGILKGSIGTAAAALEFVSVARRRFYTLDLDTDGCAAEEEVAQRILDAVEALAPAENLFAVRLAGQAKWDVLKVQDYLDGVFYIFIAQSAGTGYDIETIKKEHSRGVVGRYIAAIEQTQCPAEVAARALRFGLDALLAGRVEAW